MDYSISEQKRTVLKRFTVWLKNFSESLFGPIILLLAIILRVKTGYQEGEKLILVADNGNFKKGTDVEFIKLYDKENPFDGPSLLLVKLNGKTITLPETLLKEKSYLKRFLTGYEFNAKMIKGNWRLGGSHPFMVVKFFYLIVLIPLESAEWVVNKLKKDDDEV